MVATALKIEGLGKRYRVGAPVLYKTLRDGLAEAATRTRRKLGSAVGLGAGNQAAERQGEDFWALKDISFEVKRGEMVGIIGRNGAGKSTLLKILSRITEPTEGSVETYGRVGALLEVGTGFHPELTGRENIFLNGAILGMRREEIRKKFDEIVAFAEIERFLEAPVKHYSSGMYVRLAFAVAAHLEPDVLLVDEVLAVGDAAFQRKCIGKMHEVTSSGRTVVLVSHNMAAVNRLCRRAILLEGGKRIRDAATHEVVSDYMERLLKNPEQQARWQPEWNPQEYRDSFRFLSVHTVDNQGNPLSLFGMEDWIGIEVALEVTRPYKGVRLSLHLRTLEGVLVFSSTDADSLETFGCSYEPGRFVKCCWIPGRLLSPRQYSINLGAYLATNIIAGGEHVASFEVIHTAGPIAPKTEGVISPLLEWSFKEMVWNAS